MKSLATFLLLILLVLTSPACAQGPGTASTAVAAAERAARSWLSLVDRGRYSESWDSAAAIFRAAVAKPAWEQAVRQGRAPFEPFGERRLLSATFETRLPNAPPGRYVILQYQTKAGSGRTVIETVTPAEESDRSWRVSGYYVRPE